MSTNKHIEKICCVAVVFALLITTLFMNGEALGLKVASKVLGYETRLFDKDRVHTIDIVMDDWEGFLETCENEEYAMCTVVIDGEAFKNIGIRAKGNTSLSNVSQMDSDRYSFKLEFDQYDSTKSYHGLDKLSLNNLIQDNTMMKDFLVYQMMNEFGVDAPLCSYVYITVNGEDWGLYLAVEGVEDGFLQRNYGNDSGELYKPDSLSFGGGKGNGKDFNMGDFSAQDFDMSDFSAENFENFDFGNFDTSGFDPGSFDPGSSAPGGMTRPSGEMPSMDGMPQDGEMPLPDGEMTQGGGMTLPDDFDMEDAFGNMGGMESRDVKLQYIDDDPSSYSNIFDNAKTDIDSGDQTRLIESLKTLSSGENIEDVVNIEEVIRYFVVHNFVINDDSYTGSMIHNYYLYEKDGLLSMIPWDYNLAFGTFSGGSATDAVNDPIDSPVSGDSMDDRPMIAWIFNNKEYTEMYHQYFAEFLTTCFESGYFTELVDSTTELIAPYVEKDPGKFCTYDEFVKGAKAIKEFCLLRAGSVEGQLEGTIPSSSEAQATDNSSFIDASAISLSDMGDMGNTMGGGRGNGFGGTFGESPDRNNSVDASNGANRNTPPAQTTPSAQTNNTDNNVIPLFAASVILLGAGIFVVSRFKR